MASKNWRGCLHPTSNRAVRARRILYQLNIELYTIDIIRKEPTMLVSHMSHDKLPNENNNRQLSKQKKKNLLCAKSNAPDWYHVWLYKMHFLACHVHMLEKTKEKHTDDFIRRFWYRKLNCSLYHDNLPLLWCEL